MQPKFFLKSSTITSGLGQLALILYVAIEMLGGTQTISPTGDAAEGLPEIPTMMTENGFDWPQFAVVVVGVVLWLVNLRGRLKAQHPVKLLPN